MNSLINFALMTATSISLSSATNNIKTEDKKGQYVDDMHLVYANSKKEASRQLKKGYELVGDGALYNNSDGKGNTYLAIKRTDDINKAITDIRSMNMFGGWSISSYETVLKELNENIKDFVASIKPAINEFREKYVLAKEKYEKEGIVTGTYFAATLFDLLYDDDLINNETNLPYTILDVFTKDELYNDTNLMTIFLEGYSEVLSIIENALVYSTCSFVKEGEKCFYLSEFEEYECIEDCEECDYDSPISDLEMEQMVACISSLQETLVPFVKSGFADMNSTLSEEDYQNYLENLNKTERIEFYTASKIYPLLGIVNFLDSTLSDFVVNFNPNDDEFDINVVKPFILALSPAQRAMVPYTGLEAIFTGKYSEYTEFGKDNGEVVSYYNLLRDMVLNDFEKLGGGKCSVFVNVNRKIYRADNIALTSAAERQNAANGDFEFLEIIENSWEQSKKVFVAMLATCLTSFALTVASAIGYVVGVNNFLNDQSLTFFVSALNGSVQTDLEIEIINRKYFFDNPDKCFENVSEGLSDFAKKIDQKDKYLVNEKEPTFSHEKSLNENIKIQSKTCDYYISKEVPNGKIPNNSPTQGEKISSDFAKVRTQSENKIKACCRKVKFIKSMFYFSFLQGVVCFGVLLLMVIQAVLDHDNRNIYVAIPDMMFDETIIDGEVAYISYDVMKDFNGKNLDVTQAKRRKHDEWVSLYFTKDYRAGNPILADSFECTNKINGESEFLRKFGESGACNLTKYLSSKNNGYAYLTYSSLDTLTIRKKEALSALENYAYSIMNSLLGNSKVIYDTYREKINSCGNISDVEDTLIEAMNALNEEKVKNYEFAYPVYDFINHLEDSTDLNSDIVLARTSYEKLTSEQKEYIENIDILINLENEHEKEVIEVYKSTYLSEIKTYINSLDAFSSKEKEDLFNSAQNEIYNAQTQNELNYAKSNCYSNIDNALKDKESQAASSFAGNGNLGLLFLGLGGGLILGAAGLYATLKFLKNRKKEENE